MTLEEYPFNWRVSSWNMVVFISFVRLTLHQVMNQTNFKTWKEEGNEKVIMCDLGLFCRWRSTNQMTEDIENGRPAASWQLQSSCYLAQKEVLGNLLQLKLFQFNGYTIICLVEGSFCVACILLHTSCSWKVETRNIRM